MPSEFAPAQNDLPGERRTIDSVELRYSKENLDTRPEVALYGAR